MSDLMQTVGARLSLLNAAAFRAQLQASTEALAKFNDEQERTAALSTASAEVVTDASAEQADAVEDSAAASADAMGVAATKTAAASDAMVAAQGRVADAAVVAGAKVAGSWDAAVAGAGKILKWSALIGGVVVYEGVKKFATFQQQITQLGISAGVPTAQLSAFAKTAIAVSNNTGLAATNVGDMMYRLASANPAIKTTIATMQPLVAQAADLAVLAATPGQSANSLADTVGRVYGAVASNALSLTRGAAALRYTAAGGKSINEWALAVAGHGDMTLGQLVSAMGTGLLPVAKTYGLSLNDIGAALDVLSPAMSATSASTRLKTAIGLLGSPSQKAVEAAELVGGNATTMGGLLRKGGLVAVTNYLAGLENKAMTGSSFIGGGIYGAASGKYAGLAGAADWLKAYGFTNPALVSLLQSKGISALGGMGSAQLRGLGFGAGMTGKQAEQTVLSNILGQMFGGGRTGAAVMQLVNERGTLANKAAAIAGTENPVSYLQKLKLAFSEPAVVFGKLETAFENMTIQIGKDITPALERFGEDLLSVGQWFGKNKWALEALGGVAGTILAGAATIKAISIGEKIVSGAKYLLVGSGGTSLNAAGIKLNTAGISLQTAADRLMGTGVPGGGGAITEGEEGGVAGTGGIIGGIAAVAPLAATAAGMFGLFKLGNWMSQELTGFGKYSAALNFNAPSATRAPAKTVLGFLNAPSPIGAGVAGPASWDTKKRFNLAVQYAAAGTSMPSWLANSLSPADSGVLSRYMNAPAGSVLRGAGKTFAKTWSPASFSAQQSWQALLSHTGALGHLSGLTPTGAKTVEKAFATLSPSEQAVVETAAVHLADAGKETDASVMKLIDAASKQANAAATTQTSANSLDNAAQRLESAAGLLNTAASNAASSLSPGNIHALAVAGTKQSVARK